MGKLSAPLGDLMKGLQSMTDGHTPRGLSPETVRHLLTAHRRVGAPVELNAYLFGLTAEEQHELLAGNDAVWLAKDALAHRRYVADRLTAMVTGLEQALAVVKMRRSTTSRAGHHEREEGATDGLQDRWARERLLEG